MGDPETKVIYGVENTPEIEAVDIRFPTVEGGESITFSGTGLSDDPADYEIMISGEPCVVTEATTETVTCTTSPKISEEGEDCTKDDGNVEIYVGDKGKASTPSLEMKYVSKWSSPKTWGDGHAPMDGESVYIGECVHLLVDVD